MKQRRVQHGLTMIYKILHDHAPNYLSDTFSLTSEIHNRNTRSANSIYLNKNATSKLHRKSYSFYMAKIYNTLPEDLQNSISINVFKFSLKKYILSGKLVLPEN